MEKKKLNILSEEHRKRIDNIILYGPFCLAAVMFAGCLVVELVPIRLSADVRAQIYSTSGSVVYYLSMLLCFLYGRKYKLGWLRSLIYAVLCFELVFGKVSVLWRDLDQKLVGASSIASFRSSLFIPVLCFMLFPYGKQSVRNLCDYMTPYFFFMHGITTHHCWISGCCAGRTMSWGVWNPHTEQLAFPAQPYVIILCLVLALWGLLYARKHDYRTEGKVYSVTLIVYGFFRFIMEFFTDDKRVLGPLSVYSICSLIMVLLGAVVYFWKPKQPVEIIACETTDKIMEETI